MPPKGPLAAEDIENNSNLDSARGEERLARQIKSSPVRGAARWTKARKLRTDSEQNGDIVGVHDIACICLRLLGHSYAKVATRAHPYLQVTGSLEDARLSEAARHFDWALLR